MGKKQFNRELFSSGIEVDEFRQDGDDEGCFEEAVQE
jgi:hypothetical protein